MLKGYAFWLASIFLAASTTANGVHLNHDRKGQVALLPFYTVTNNFITNFTLTNTTDRFKAVRVRIVDALLGADLLNINVYLAPHDVWNATLRKNLATGLPNLITEDESCTYPSKTLLHAGVDLQDIYLATTDRELLKGYIEVIEMGEIADGSGPAEDTGLEAEIDANGIADGVISGSDRSIPQGLLHDTQGLPNDCSVVTDAWGSGAAVVNQVNGFEPGKLSVEGIAEDLGDTSSPYANSTNAGLVPPGGGVNVYGILLNAANGDAYVVEGVHIDRYTSVAQHYLPDDPVYYRLPSLASGDIREAYITNGEGNGRKGDSLPLTEYDTGALQDITPKVSVPMGSNPLPIALVLSAESVSVPYFVEWNLAGETDIVLTFPMRKFGIFNDGTLTNQFDINQPACAGQLNDGVDDGQAVTLPDLGVVVEDYPHTEDGEFCSNLGFVESSDFMGFTVRDITMTLAYWNYQGEEQKVVFETDMSEAVQPPFIDLGRLALTRTALKVVTLYSNDGLNQPIFREDDPVTGLLISTKHNFDSGWIRFKFDAQYDYNTNLSIQALTEPRGGLGQSVDHTWSGVPVLGFSAMRAQAQSGRMGETIELTRSTNRD
ncbi:MAG: hypothetical protein ABW101_03585 [Candidatus Thiodiazotropha sp.]